MESDFQKMQKRALEIREKYSETDPKQWDVEQVFMGMTKDFGELSKLLMIHGGYRDDKTGDIKNLLEHEISDVLYSIFILAGKLNVDLEASFWKTMDELDQRLSK